MSKIAFQDACGVLRADRHPDAFAPIHTHSSEMPADVLPPSPRQILYNKLEWIWPYYLHEFPQSKFIEIVWARYNIDEPIKLTLEQLADVFNHFRSVLMNLEKRSA